MKRLVLCLAAALVRGAGAQAPAVARCDSIVATSGVDQVPSGLFLSARRVDGGEMSDARMARVIASVGASFDSPKPFKLSVFAGPALMRGLRAIAADTHSVARAPTLTGVYRVFVARDHPQPVTRVIRESMMTGFDTAAVAAIDAAATAPEVFALEPADDSLRLELTFSTDSLSGSRRLAAATFPRMPVVDASPLPNNPPAVYPPELAADSVRGPVLLRFVVTPDGYAAAGTIEVLRAPAIGFIKAALEALAAQRFTPAMIRGCPVAQQVDYPFVFIPRI